MELFKTHNLFSIEDLFRFPSIINGPAFDFTETATEYKIEADLPGVTEQDLNITLDKNLLTIEGKRTDQVKQPEAKYRETERTFGNFKRQFRLPAISRERGVTAQLRDGVLLVTVSKAPELQAKQIKITRA